MKGKGLLLPAAEQADEPAVEDGAHDGAPFDAHKIAKAEENKRKRNAQSAAAAIINNLGGAQRGAEFFGKFLDKKLVGFRRQIGMEQQCHAEGAEQGAHNKESHIPAQPGKRQQSHQSNHTVENEAVDNSGHKGQGKVLFEFAGHQGQQQDQTGLKGIDGHAKAEKGEILGHLQVDQIGGGNDHGQTEIRPFHQRTAEAQHQKTHQIGQFAIKYSLFLHKNIPARKFDNAHSITHNLPKRKYFSKNADSRNNVRPDYSGRTGSLQKKMQFLLIIRKRGKQI